MTLYTSLRAIVRAVTPVGILELRRARRRQVGPSDIKADRSRQHEERHRRIELVSKINTATELNADQYEKVIEFLVGQGVSELDVREGSIPQASLEFINKVVLSKLSTEKPLLVLHIGNYVGVSLAYITEMVVKLNPQSVVVAIDPNIPHRATSNPQSLVMKLLHRCGLQGNVISITGFSERKNISNDGAIFGAYDPVSSYSEEFSCDRVLSNLRTIFEKKFDVVCLDGNHHADYLESELKSILPLMKEDSWVVLDDVDDAWVEIRNVFNSASKFGFEVVATNQRVGIARLRGQKQVVVAAGVRN
jgi:hypothetical protein